MSSHRSSFKPHAPTEARGDVAAWLRHSRPQSQRAGPDASLLVWMPKRLRPSSVWLAIPWRYSANSIHKPGRLIAFAAVRTRNEADGWPDPRGFPFTRGLCDALDGKQELAYWPIDADDGLAHWLMRRVAESVMTIADAMPDNVVDEGEAPNDLEQGEPNG